MFMFSSTPGLIRPADPSRGLGALVLGSAVNEADLSVLREYNITHILQVGAELAPSHADKGFVYKRISIQDSENENLRRHFADCLAFVDEGRRAGNVLVHCMAGISRSSTICIAYLMQTEGLPVKAAISSVRSVRSCIYPNVGFFMQLEDFAAAGSDPTAPCPAWDKNIFAARLRQQREAAGPGNPTPTLHLPRW